LSLPEQWAERELLADLRASIELDAGIVDVRRVEGVSETCLLTTSITTFSSSVARFPAYFDSPFQSKRLAS
jgi:hypothetical protein